MRGLRLRKNLGVVGIILIWAAAVSAAPNPFYTNLLERGKADFASGDYQRAADELRIASFGLLDAIPAYETTQVYLALAQQRIGRKDEASKAVLQIVQAERIAPTYRTLAIDPSVQAALNAALPLLFTPEQLITLNVAPLLGTGSAAPVVPPPPAAPAPPPASAAPVHHSSEMAPARSSPAQTTSPPPRAPATVTASLPAPRTPPPPPPAPVKPRKVVVLSSPAPSQGLTDRTVTDALRAGKTALSEGKPLQARDLYLSLSNRTDLTRGQLLEVARGLAQSSTFQESAAVYDRAGRLKQGEEVHLFYKAVDYYEMGDLTRARDYLKLALPHIPMTRTVSEYKAKIESAQ
jgi:tetratricopeptide (TPR) repeat protein